MRTYFPKQGDIEPKWFIIDAEGQVLGRLSSAIAKIISGKSKPTYTPFLDTGDHVIARVEKRRVRRLALAGDDLRDRGRQTAEDLAFGVDDEPLRFDVALLRKIGTHDSSLKRNSLSGTRERKV